MQVFPEPTTHEAQTCTLLAPEAFQFTSAISEKSVIELVQTISVKGGQIFSVFVRTIRPHDRRALLETTPFP